MYTLDCMGGGSLLDSQTEIKLDLKKNLKIIGFFFCLKIYLIKPGLENGDL